MLFAVLTWRSDWVWSGASPCKMICACGACIFLLCREEKWTVFWCRYIRDILMASYIIMQGSQALSSPINGTFGLRGPNRDLLRIEILPVAWYVQNMSFSSSSTWQWGIRISGARFFQTDNMELRGSSSFAVSPLPPYPDNIQAKNTKMATRQKLWALDGYRVMHGKHQNNIN